MQEPDPEIDAIARAAISAAYEVHRILGPGYLESVYEEALVTELSMRNISFSRQVPIAMTYKGVAIGACKIDLVISDRLVVELKAAESLLPIHVAQVLSYLKATGNQLGLRINFNVRYLAQGVRRVILTQ